MNDEKGDLKAGFVHGEITKCRIWESGGVWGEGGGGW